MILLCLVVSAWAGGWEEHALEQVRVRARVEERELAEEVARASEAAWHAAGAALDVYPTRPIRVILVDQEPALRVDPAAARVLLSTRPAPAWAGAGPAEWAAVGVSRVILHQATTHHSSAAALGLELSVMHTDGVGVDAELPLPTEHDSWWLDGLAAHVATQAGLRAWTPTREALGAAAAVGDWPGGDVEARIAGAEWAIRRRVGSQRPADLARCARQRLGGVAGCLEPEPLPAPMDEPVEDWGDAGPAPEQLSWSPGGGWVAVWGGGAIRLVGADGKRVQVAGDDLAWLAEGERALWLAAGTLWQWSAGSTPQRVAELPGATALAVHPTGEELALAVGPSVHLYRLRADGPSIDLGAQLRIHPQPSVLHDLIWPAPDTERERQDPREALMLLSEGTWLHPVRRLSGSVVHAFSGWGGLRSLSADGPTVWALADGPQAGWLRYRSGTLRVGRAPPAAVAAVRGERWARVEAGLTGWRLRIYPAPENGELSSVLPQWRTASPIPPRPVDRERAAAPAWVRVGAQLRVEEGARAPWVLRGGPQLRVHGPRQELARAALAIGEDAEASLDLLTWPEAGLRINGALAREQDPATPSSGSGGADAQIMSSRLGTAAVELRPPGWPSGVELRWMGSEVQDGTGLRSTQSLRPRASLAIGEAASNTRALSQLQLRVGRVVHLPLIVEGGSAAPADFWSAAADATLGGPLGAGRHAAARLQAALRPGATRLEEQVWLGGGGGWSTERPWEQLAFLSVQPGALVGEHALVGGLELAQLVARPAARPKGLHPWIRAGIDAALVQDRALAQARVGLLLRQACGPDVSLAADLQLAWLIVGPEELRAAPGLLGLGDGLEPTSALPRLSLTISQK